MSLVLSRLSAFHVILAAALLACAPMSGMNARAADNAAPGASGTAGAPPVDSELSRRVLEALSRNAQTATKPPATATPAAQSPAPVTQPVQTPRPVQTAPVAAPVPMPFPAPISTTAVPALPAPASPAATPAPALPGAGAIPGGAPGALNTPAAVPLTHLPVSNSNNNPQPVVVRMPEVAPTPAPVLTPAPARAAAPRPAAAAATAAVAGSSYTIRPGDTFSSIAAEKYGDEKKWTAIAQSNPLVDPAKLKVGQVVRLPDLKAFEAQRSQPFEQLRQGLPPAVPTIAGPGGEVTVQKGDTLSHIAEKAYGKPTLWPVIYRANRDVLDTPNDVKPGMKLKIPPKP